MSEKNTEPKVSLLPKRVAISPVVALHAPKNCISATKYSVLNKKIKLT